MTSDRWAKRFVLTLSAGVVLLACDGPAEAVPALLRAGTRPMWAWMSVGPAVNLDKAVTQFKLSQTFGYHFSGDAGGPALAFDIQESLGEGVLLLELGPKFVWDIQLIDGVGFYLSPAVMAGFAHATTTSPYVHDSGGASGFSLQLVLEGKLVLADRGLIFFRPVCVDVIGLSAGGQFDVGTRYDLVLGGGLIF